MRKFQKLCLATTITAVAVVTVGALVRSSGSGLGCPDWPRCHGSWVPPLQAKALIEYSHRLVVFVLSVLGLATVAFAWLSFRRVRSIFLPAIGAVGVVVVQAWVGRLVVLRELPEGLVALHFFIALSLLAVLTVLTVNAGAPRGGRLDPLAKFALYSAGAVFAALMAGALVSQTGAALVFGDWPLMRGRLVPGGRPPELIHFAHRALALLAGVVLVIQARRVARQPAGDPSLVRLGWIAVGLWSVQAGVGAANVLARSAVWAVVVHVLFASLLWVVTVAIAARAYRSAGAGIGEPSDLPTAPAALSTGTPRPLTSTIKAYFLLTKPRIIELLLITTVPAMIVAAGRVPSLGLMLATLAGGSLAAGSANAINCYFDRDIDERMQRTSGRPLPRGEIEPAAALWFGVIVGLIGIALLAVAVNRVAALLALSAIVFYVLVYTLALKRSTHLNIVIGGAAGAVPVLVGWAAVTGGLALPALIMFAIVFYWTPPHFWALSLRYARDYRAAGVPMLPVVKGEAETKRQILLYSLALVGTSLALYSAGGMGVVYLSVAAAGGAAFVGYAARLRRASGAGAAMSLFRFSIGYLTLVFVAMGADRILDAYRPVSLHVPVLAVSGGLILLSHGALLARTLRRGPVSAPAPTRS